MTRKRAVSSLVIFILFFYSQVGYSQNIVLVPEGQKQVRLSDKDRLELETERRELLSRLLAIEDKEMVKKLADFFMVYDNIRAGYVDNKTSAELLDLAMVGMVTGLDPYSSLSMNENAESTGGRLVAEDNFVGVGMTIAELHKTIVIMEVYDGSPAAQVGLEPGDVISKVDGQDVFGMTTQKVSSLIKRGEEGTSVVLEIKSARFQKPKLFTIARRRVVIESVAYKELKGGYYYIKIRSFRPETADRFADALRQSAGKKGLILDLRDNGGGSTSAVQEMLGLLIGPGKNIVTFKGRNVNQNVNTESSAIPGVPSKIVVLVNNFSASASEIMAGNIKHYKIGDLVGVRTFGKSTGQNYLPLDGRNLKESQFILGLTVARFYLPNGEEITGKGVEPDVEIEQPEDFKRFQYLTKRDAQFQKALEALKK